MRIYIYRTVSLAFLFDQMILKLLSRSFFSLSPENGGVCEGVVASSLYLLIYIYVCMYIRAQRPLRFHDDDDQ